MNEFSTESGVKQTVDKIRDLKMRKFNKDCAENILAIF